MCLLSVRHGTYLAVIACGTLTGGGTSAIHFFCQFARNFLQCIVVVGRRGRGRPYDTAGSSAGMEGLTLEEGRGGSQVASLEREGGGG